MLKLGLPSKGRIQAQTFEWFAARGLKIDVPEAREYAAVAHGLPGVAPVLLSAGEIPRELATGRLHFGVTGQDLVAEHLAGREDAVAPIATLGFAHADMIVAVPSAWVDVSHVADLDDVAVELRARHGRGLRVATKFAHLTRAFLRDKGLADYRIIASQGATEGVVKNGLADVIVDITSTGATLRANHLKILEDGLILQSQATLFRAATAPWTDETTTLADGFAAALDLRA